MRLEWEKFANHANEKDVPTTGMDEDVVQEMMLLQEIDDDASSDIALLVDESETEDVDVLTTPTLSAGPSSSCSSDSGSESSDKERVEDNDLQSKLAEFGTAAHDNKTQRRSGQPLDKTQQKLQTLHRPWQEMQTMTKATMQMTRELVMRKATMSTTNCRPSETMISNS